MISIVAGDWRGRKIRVPDSRDVRPSTNRVRAACFNIIESIWLKSGREQRWEDAKVLDLFAGSGALGLEALSRGAQTCTFVESARGHAKVIAENIKGLGCEKSAVLLNTKLEEWWPQAEQRFDVVFADPPYDFVGWGALLQRLQSAKCLESSAVLCLESRAGVVIEPQSGLIAHSTRTMGPAQISIFTQSGNRDIVDP